MIKTEFDFEGTNVVAFAHSTDGYNAHGLVLKFVDEDGERVFPNFNEKQIDEIEEMAMELLADQEYEQELDF